MSTSKKSASKKALATSSAAVVTQVAATAAPDPVPAPATVVAPPAAIPAAVVTTVAASVPSGAVVELPPADANIPSPPDGFVATNGTDYRGVTPKKSELVVLPKALAELAKFTRYTAVFGLTAPPLATLQATLTAALEWSLMRNSTEAWDLFARTMEGLAWTDARPLIDKASDAFDSAAETDATVKTENPSLTSFFNVATVIAQKGVETRKANAKSRAKGETPTKGKAAAKANKEAKIVAAAAAKAAAAAVTPEPAAPQGAPSGAAPTAPANAPAGTNGAAH